MYQATQNLEKIIDEKYEKLELLAELLLKWNKKINLVAESTEDEIWERHILDSAQLIKFIPRTVRTIGDFGSGAGFPGLVLAIMTNARVTLIESDNKKTIFLQEAARITNTEVKIINDRIEKVQGMVFDLVTARALADVNKLLELAEPFLKPDSRCLFLKGKKAGEELAEAKKFWQVTETISPSIVTAEDEFKNRADQGFILDLRDVARLNV